MTSGYILPAARAMIIARASRRSLNKRTGSRNTITPRRARYTWHLATERPTICGHLSKATHIWDACLCVAGCAAHLITQKRALSVHFYSWIWWPRTHAERTIASQYQLRTPKLCFHKLKVSVRMHIGLIEATQLKATRQTISEMLIVFFFFLG